MDTERQFMKHYGQMLTFLDGLNVVIEVQHEMNVEKQNHPKLSIQEQDAFLKKNISRPF